MTDFLRNEPTRHLWHVLLAFLALIFMLCALGNAAPTAKKPSVLNVSNPTPNVREEVIAVPLADVLRRLATADPSSVGIEILPDRQKLPMQIFSSVAGAAPDTVLTLVNVGASQNIRLRFFVGDGETASEPKPLVFGRTVPERKDDFAWENDKVAYRVYGPALQATGEISSGIDVWSKRVSDLIINDWYAKDAAGQRTKNPAITYHKDSGQGLDS
jgi:Domain of unknown function (DUF4861)